jgi:hypothetical protein
MSARSGTKNPSSCFGKLNSPNPMRGVKCSEPLAAARQYEGKIMKDEMKTKLG